MNKQTILDRIDYRVFYRRFIPSLKEAGKGKSTGLCPLHEDHNPSFSADLERGFFKCFACGKKGDIFTFYELIKNVDFKTALKEIGEMFGITGTEKSKVVSIFEYQNAEGIPLYLKERIEPGRNGRTKEFLFKHWEKDKLVLDRGCEPVLYNLPGIITCKDTVVVVEGEGKVDFLKKWDIVATCLDSGANSPWKEDYTKALERKEKVVILPDNDKHGKSYAEKGANALYGKDGIIKVVELPGLKEGEDIINWAKIEGNNKEKFLKIIEASQEWIPQQERESVVGFTPVRLKDFMGSEPPQIEWLVDELIVQEGVILLIGKPKIGKSILALNVALSIAQGNNVLGKTTKQGKTLYMALEDRPKLVKSRLWKILKGQRDIGMYVNCGPVALNEENQRKAIKNKIQTEGYSLVVLDPLIEAYRRADENSSNDMVEVLRWIREIAQHCGCSFLVVHHARKSDGAGGDIIRGTSAIFGAVDGAIILRDISREKDSKRVSVEAILRDVDTGEKTVARLDGSLQWEMEGSFEDFTIQTTSEKILEFLRSNGEAAISQIVQGTGEGYDAVQKAARRLEEKGIIHGRQKGNNPKAGKVYYLSKEMSDENVRRENVNNINELDKKDGLIGQEGKVSDENDSLSDENKKES